MPCRISKLLTRKIVKQHFIWKYNNWERKSQNHNRHRQPNEPIKTRTKYSYPSAGTKREVSTGLAITLIWYEIKQTTKDSNAKPEQKWLKPRSRKITFPAVRVILRWQSPSTRDFEERPSSLNHLLMPSDGMSWKIKSESTCKLRFCANA